MEDHKKICVAYYRLSDEENKRGESMSIENQRLIVNDYCEKNGILIAREFVDDGYTGATFDRPGFSSMINFVSTNKIRIVITKDLSRLGRDMSESSFYAETYFPERGIKYLALGDDFDSDTVNVLAPFQFAMNDVYLRDSSRKVKEAIHSRASRGIYCSCPPYGYKKAPGEHSGKLVPDEETAPVVSRIFDMIYRGYPAYQVVEILNSEGVIPPLLYRTYRDNFSDRGARHASTTWNVTTVNRMLRNEVYLGHTILGRYKKASIKSSKKIKIPKEQWKITHNTHQPLVTKDVFEYVQKIKSTTARTYSNAVKNARTNIFAGLVHCASCGAAMCSCGTTYKGEANKYWFLSCNNIPMRSRNHCEHGARIRYSDLIEIVKEDINSYAVLQPGEIDTIVQNAVASIKDTNNPKLSQSTLNDARKRQREIDVVIAKLYRDNAAGKIDDERLDRMVESFYKESNGLKQSIQKMQDEDKHVKETEASYAEFFRLVKQYTPVEKLTRDVLITLIKDIRISERVLLDGRSSRVYNPNGKLPSTQEIHIIYNYVGDISDTSQSHIKDMAINL